MKLKDDVLLDIEDLKQKSIEDINAQGLRNIVPYIPGNKITVSALFSLI